jgi:hypothetical protein
LGTRQKFYNRKENTGKVNQSKRKENTGGRSEVSLGKRKRKTGSATGIRGRVILAGDR